MASQMD